MVEVLHRLSFSREMFIRSDVGGSGEVASLHFLHDENSRERGGTSYFSHVHFGVFIVGDDTFDHHKTSSVVSVSVC